jgi:SAM-dependent methyltransferase
VVLASRQQEDDRSNQALSAARAVLWHDLECGSYSADLPLWRELADASGLGQAERVLDVGAGTGRVTLELARSGHEVTALDLDPALLVALKERARGLGVEVVAGDARTFALPGHEFGLCVAPMQTIQLLGGSSARSSFLRRARAHLRPGGLLACAIVTELEPFDCAAGDVGPAAETARVDGDLYITSAVRVRMRRRSIRIERQRQILPAGRALAPRPTLRELNVVELDRVSATQLEREGVEAGLTPQPARTIAPTADHVGSVVVILRA